MEQKSADDEVLSNSKLNVLVYFAAKYFFYFCK